MIKVVFEKGVNEIDVCGLTQWDKGRHLEIHCNELQGDIQVHFAHEDDREALVTLASVQDSVAVVQIPDILLRQGKDLTAWVYVTSETSGKTVKTINAHVTERPKPEDYIAGPAGPYVMEQILDKVRELESHIKQVAFSGCNIIGVPMETAGDAVVAPTGEYYPVIKRRGYNIKPGDNIRVIVYIFDIGSRTFSKYIEMTVQAEENTDVFWNNGVTGATAIATDATSAGIGIYNDEKDCVIVSTLRAVNENTYRRLTVATVLFD